jgi:hypothetical protein
MVYVVVLKVTNQEARGFDDHRQRSSTLESEHGWKV